MGQKTSSERLLDVPESLKKHPRSSPFTKWNSLGRDVTMPRSATAAYKALCTSAALQRCRWMTDLEVSSHRSHASQYQ
eukprot:Skav231685  [mRNA]  locus=scaffold597:938592:952137:- [translate_table: standard]